VTDAAAPRRYRLWRDGRLALDVTGEPGILVSTSAPPPLPGQPPATHPFATATAYVAEWEGQLGALLRESSDLDAFLAEAGRNSGHPDGRRVPGQGRPEPGLER
jgi:hypothetical protein